MVDRNTNYGLDFLITHIGQNIADMHYGRFANHKVLNEHYLIRNAIEWTIRVDDDILPSEVAKREWKEQETWRRENPMSARNRNIRAGQRHYDYLNCIPFRGGYVNKMLIVVGAPGTQPGDEGWWPVMYNYDGVRIGVAEIKERTRNVR